MLTNHCLRSFPSKIKEIRAIPFHNVSLELLWNTDFIFLRYKFYMIPASAEKNIYSMYVSFFFWMGSS